MARRATRAVAERTVRSGADYLPEAVATPSGKGRLASVAPVSNFLSG